MLRRGSDGVRCGGEREKVLWGVRARREAISASVRDARSGGVR